MNAVQATLRAALTLYASHIADMQRAADTVSPSDNVRLDEILAARSRVEGMRKDLAEAFAHVHAMRAADESCKATTESDDGRVVRDLPPGLQNWLVYYIARQRREALFGGAAAELSRAAISQDLTNALRRAGWLI